MRVDGGLLGQDLHLGYHGKPVVQGASLRIEAGEVTALIGPNGSGKSTLLRALARLHHADKGAISFPDGGSAFDLSAKDFARRVTLLTQSRPTPSGVSVRDVVGYGRHPYRSRWRDDDHDGQRAIDHAMDVTGVAAMAERAVDELSGGELQRVWLATCIAQDTGVLLLDEPTTFLDLRYQIEILDLMRDLADDHHVAVGVVLHDLNQAAAVADRVALLDRGKVRATGTPAEVFDSIALTETYGIQIDVRTDVHTGRLTAEPFGRHLQRLA
ncbi:ABC transporter ATP-binding protein [Kribbella deserti]|uniref:ABC transporter ATP-binding protein n=1 Tax=Kribbella deserti TaxID=1926257 RepID=A0ABV6QWJ0_9ACTN